MLHTLVFPIPFRMESQTLDKKRATSAITNMDDNLSMRSRILELSYRVCFSRDLSLGLTVCKALGFGILQSASIVSKGLCFCGVCTGCSCCNICCSIDCHYTYLHCIVKTRRNKKLHDECYANEQSRLNLL